MKPILEKIDKSALNEIHIDRILEMAWEDRTPFDAIQFQFGLAEADVKALMKKELKFSGYKLWRERVENCKTKHVARRPEAINRFKCDEATLYFK
ncbi:TIGR03643 family protein [Flavobacterium sp. P21]|uniref:TIGR03643 family protein n=1 Tax=Flavobacterium sp. P21 TaxID=3423948 RepID=UPI003D666300